MRVLVTGHHGYVGSVLTCVLRHGRFDVVGLDAGWLTGCDFGSTTELVEHYACDVRDVEFADLCSFDAVVHLAGLSDAASCELDPDATEEINFTAAVRLAEACKQAQVPRFVFASCCSVYAPSGNDLLHEESPTEPTSRFARTKLRTEQALLALADDGFCPTVIRQGTVYGVSPRLRTDTVVNDLAASALTMGKVILPTAGRAWQPLIHVADLARVYAAILTAEADRVRGEVFNAVRSGESYRLIDVADVVTDFVSLATRHTLHGGFDPASYRIDGTKLERTFPRLQLRWTLPLGVRQLVNAMSHAGMTPGLWRSDCYRRALRLQALRQRNLLDDSLRITQPALV